MIISVISKTNGIYFVKITQKERQSLGVPAIKQVRNEICPFGQVMSLCDEIFASQM